jgi:hypothetical protein
MLGLRFNLFGGGVLSRWKRYQSLQLGGRNRSRRVSLNLSMPRAP